MSKWEKIKTVVTSDFPTFENVEANKLMQFTIASAIIEIAIIVFFLIWFVFQGGGYWESRAIVYSGCVILFITILSGGVLSIKIDKNNEYANKLRKYKALIIILVIITIAVVVSLTIEFMK